MRHKRVEDFFAYECAVNFKEEVHRIVCNSPAAYKDFRYRSELWEATDSVDADMAEGFARGNPGECANFLRYALGSLEEAKRRLKNGITREYFSESDCQPALIWADRCVPATRTWLASQRREHEQRQRRKRRRRDA